ncbi:glycoporin [Salmonella enterica subsp. enterica]|uniref:Glycoporin n=1 Tax=Salmonella enterica I TaxID=59201 RepID=A0A379WNT8_SALET|nr:glycoporin [Salmonella enterica subsp. enterica]
MIGACFSHNLWAANNITIEQRLAELEQRVVNAEKRASDAEAQIRSLKQQQVAATPTVNVQSAEPIAADKTPPKLTYPDSAILSSMAMSNLIWMRQAVPVV